MICEKLNLNKTAKIITYDEFKKELEFTISLMTGQVKINAIDELIKSIDYIQDNEIEINEESNNNMKIIMEIIMKMIIIHLFYWMII